MSKIVIKDLPANKPLSVEDIRMVQGGGVKEAAHVCDLVLDYRNRKYMSLGSPSLDVRSNTKGSSIKSTWYSKVIK